MTGFQVPKEYIPGVTKGLEEMMSSGALAGFPVVDLVATLYDGSYHDVDSSVLAFQIAARQAFRQAAPTMNSEMLLSSKTSPKSLILIVKWPPLPRPIKGQALDILVNNA